MPSMRSLNLAKLLVAAAAALFSLTAWPQSQHMPAPSEVFGTELSKEADDFLTTCNIEFNQKQQALEEQWANDYERYDVDLDRGVLWLTRKDKEPIYFDVEVVGSLSSTDKSWEWAWNN